MTQVDESNVLISITKTSEYCGGISPREEVLKNLSTPSKLVNEKIYILKEGTEDKDVLLGTTDENGQLKINLPQGTFQIYRNQKWNAVKSFNSGYSLSNSRNCAEWLKSGEAILTIVEDTSAYTINLHSICNPCEQRSR